MLSDTRTWAGFSHNTSLSGHPGPKSQKSLKKVSRCLRPRGPKKSGKSPKSQENVSKISVRDFFELRTPRPATEPRNGRPRISTKNVKVRDHMASRGSSQKDQCQRAHSTLSIQIIIYRHCIISQKLDFRHHLILPVLISLSSLDLCFHSSLVIVIVKSILIFDMVAEQSPDSGPDSFATSFFCPVQSSHDDSTTTRSTNQITSSSGEEERSHWSSKLQEEPDI